MNSEESYIQDYRHFDNLIWQIPAWASAIFSFSVTTSVLALSNAKSIESTLPIDAGHAVAVFLFSVFFVFLLLTCVFLRFRLHQRSIYRPNRKHVPSKWFLVPGQSALLLVLFLESGVILSFALVTVGLNAIHSIAVGMAFLLIGFSYVEWSIRKLSNEIKSKRDPVKIVQ